MTTITREQAQKIIEAADEVISALAGTNEDVHPGSDNMLRLWDDLNDRYAPPEVVRELARIALASLEAEPVVYMWDSERKDIDAPGYYRTEHLVFAESSVKQWGGRVVPLYTAQPVPVTPDGWISCSERMPEKNQNVLISVNFDSSLVEPLICSARYTGSTFRRGDATIKPGNGIEQATHWMPLPEPPQEAK
ncbi:DUF551 domain-containing protein [Salmonella enterica subsp. enterica serovar Mbandaka]|uniref:DUF551 domain-containing protein n=1 Tax=Escherichia coli TaxID=562 RepID=UPI00071B6775|nr:DUF551 domain-containing protein [Escherichia coli]EGI0565503.1 DUF551 domain-containing protein [Salmonella enterica subsp. enterica serovar Mbandaka]EJO4718426.1 DUF551 domain-containing protein [Escherichia coli]EJO8681590.1 DUF551 domain-containing protein [Escherichia coli]ELC4108970.1 DUF551 domain-containing protein [Escherichia coli]KST31870.1 hypothetical protein APZ13_01320 [Escherichia coli]